MTAAVRLHLAGARRDRGMLAPLAALAFAVLGVFAYAPNDVGPTWALTALLAFPLTAWLAGAVLRSLPDAHRETVVCAAGGARAHDRATLVLVLLLALGVSAVFIAYPLIIGAFDRPVTAADLVDTTVAHLACGGLGGQLGRAVSPPVVTRRADAAVAVLGATLVSVAVEPLAGAAGGPMSVADRLADADRGGLLAACAACLGLVAVLALVRRRLTRWAG